MAISETKIDKEQLKRMLSDGKSLTQCAKHFGCSIGAVSHTKKRLIRDGFVMPAKKVVKPKVRVKKPNRGIVDIRKMEKMLLAGKKTSEVAKYFGVTPGAISQRKKSLRNLVVRSAAMENASSVVHTHLDVMGQLHRANDIIIKNIELVQGEIEAAKGTERIANRKLLIDYLAEIRRQWDSQIKILELWHDMRVIGDFHNEVLNILEEVQPGLRNEIIRRLKARRAVRATVKFS